MSSAKKHLHFIINPKSGIQKKSKIVDALKRELSKEFEYTVTLTKKAEHATEIAHEASKNKANAVIAVGGDGTVNEVGKALIGTEVALGVIPSGSGNGFARHLQIPMQCKAAVQVINTFDIKKIDTASVNGKPFLATAGLGFDAHVGWKFADFGRRGFWSYIRVTTNEFFSFKPRQYELIIDGKQIETTAFLINFANTGQYGNNAWIAPSASVFDGKLNVCILERFPSRLAPEIVFKLFNKQIEKSNYYRLIQAKEIWVKKPMEFHMDGEPQESERDLFIKVVPGSLNVIC
ncbi:diacylglycerol kinase family lipid kinase [Fulvivirga sp. M361]|uniref:diacylglycerol/lipid kinase family protein n=1 Tax=Fulvivirga sp. M361 TaxID=2594266 RepID=UPI00117B1F46|nr:diacylglycerol kinase family protein [Fulvivirga sp. M361]TRX56077.1 diacylglycerol kinase family lipid kinase [Fulvivirga sp. M361]